MATKAELEHADRRYREHCERARHHFAAKEFPDALDNSEKALAFVDGMMQYQRKYMSQEFDSIEAIDIILLVAPALFRQSSIDAIVRLLSTYRRVERNTAANLGQKVDDAYKRLFHMRRLWNQLSDPDDKMNQCDPSDAETLFAMEVWRHVGLVSVTDQGALRSYVPATRMNQMMRCKCFSSGASGKSRKSVLLDKVECPRCRTHGYFVMIGPV
jgi:hypothetical protein